MALLIVARSLCAPVHSQCKCPYIIKSVFVEGKAPFPGKPLGK